MLDPHTSVGIAQVVFYAPMVPLVIYLFSRNARIRPRMAWWPFIPFSLFRLAGGIITIIAEKQKSNTGLFIAALVILNVGVVPLIVANLGLTRLILMDNHAASPTHAKISKALRLLIVAATALLGAGGGLASTQPAVAHDLTLAGYILFAVELLFLFAVQTHSFLARQSLLPSSRRVLTSAMAAFPFLMLRTVYGLLQIVDQEKTADSVWNPLTGSAVGFALMALLPEFVVLAAWVATGLAIPPRREVGEVGETGKV